MHRLKLVELSEITPWDWFNDYTALHPACVKAAQGYEASIMRVHGLASCLGQSFMCGEQWMQAAIIAAQICPDLDSESQEFKVECLKAFVEVSKFPNQQAYNEAFRRATHNADEHHHQMNPVYEGFYALVQSVVIQAWSAFEVLTEDLHTHVREECPSHFRSIPLNHKDYSFRSQERIPGAYKRLFSGHQGIIATVTNSDVRALGLLRHLLVHKNGRVDQKHLDEREELPVVHQLDAFGLKSYVILDGVLVRSLVDPVIGHAFKLIVQVSTWLYANQPI